MVDREDQGARGFDIQGGQYLGPGDIAVINRIAAGAGLGDSMGIEIDGDEGNAGRLKPGGDGAANAAEPGDHDMAGSKFGFDRRLAGLRRFGRFHAIRQGRAQLG